MEEFCVGVASFIASSMGYQLYKMEQEDEYQLNFHGFHYARGKKREVKQLGKFTPFQIASSAALIGAAVLAAAAAVRFTRRPPPPAGDAPSDVQLTLTRMWVIEEYLGGDGDGNGV